MRSTEYLGLLRAMPGVVRAELVPADLVQSVAEMEASITRASGGMKLENSGMVQCLKRSMVAVVFCDCDFKRPEAVTMRMVDTDGVVIGHDVPPSRMDEFRARDDVLWIASGFIMYADLICSNDATMVMDSSSLMVAGAPEDSVAEMFYPSCSSSDMINTRFAMPGGMISNAIVGIDGIDLDDDEYRMVETVPNGTVVGGVLDRDE